MKKKLLVTAAVSSLAAASYIVIGTYFYELALKTKKKNVNELDVPFEQTEPDEAQKADERFINEQPMIEKYIISSDSRNLKLHASVYENKSLTHKWALLVHGYTGQNGEMIRWARGFFEKGFNVLNPDLRGHGKSEGNYIGMGWHDRGDILDWIHAIIEEDPEAEIILLGVSMGATTVMMTSGEVLPINVKVIIEDCGFSSVKSVLGHQLYEIFKLPAFPILQAANMITQLRAGYNIFEASAVKQLKKAKVPMLFIHGDKDTFVPYKMLEEVYAAAPVEKEKLTIFGANHAESIKANPELYWQTIWKFSSRFMNIDH